MSVEVSSWAWKVSGLSPSEKLVLLCLADHSDRDGISWPSQKTIAEKTLVSRETVNRAIAKFIELKLLTKEPLGSAYPFNQMYRYRVNCHTPVTLDHNPCDVRSQPPVTSDHTEPSLKNRHRNRHEEYPDNFTIDEATMELALKNGWPNPHTELEAFRDYHLARGARFVDWRRAFHTWLRNAKRFSNGKREQKEGELSERTMRILRRGL